MRLAIAGAILVVMAMATGQLRVAPGDRPQLATLGLVGFTLSLGLQFWGTKLSTAHNGGLISSASPAFIVLFARRLLKERLAWPNLVALGLASAGVLAVIGPETSSAGGSSVWLGNLCLLGAAIIWALYTVMGKLASQRYSSLTIAAYATVAGLFFTAPIAWWTEWRGLDLTGVPAVAWWGVAYVGIISTAVAFYLWVLGFTLIDVGTGSLFFFAQPLVAAVLGALLLGETLHWYFYLGAALIFAGLVVSTWWYRPPAEHHS